MTSTEQQMEKPSDHGERKSLAKLKLYNFMVYGTLSIMATYFPLFLLTEKGLSELEIGILMAGGPFISIFANPFWGFWSDKYQNIRRTLFIILIANLVIVQLIFQMKPFVLLYGLMLLYFFFNNPVFSQSNSLILNAIEGTPYKFGSFRIWGSLGWAIVAVASGPLVYAMGLGNIWVLYTVMMLGTLGLMIGMPRGKPKSSSGKFSAFGYGKIFTNKLFLMFVLLGVLISVPNSMNHTFVSIHIKDLGGSEVLVGWSAFFMAIFEIPVFLLFDRYMKKDTKFMVACLVVVSLLFSLRWLVMSMASAPWHIIGVQLFHSITFGGYYYVGTTLTAHLVPSEYRATGQAAFALTWGGVSGIMAGFIGGYVYQNLGPEIMYRMNAVIAFCGMIGFMLMLVVVQRMRGQSGEAGIQVSGAAHGQNRQSTAVERN